MKMPDILRWRKGLLAALRACEHYAARAPLRFSLLAVLALLAIVVVALAPSYDTNDDVFMTMIASGQGFCPAPDEHLVFTNVIIGQALQRLYTACPRFPWYGCYLLLVHYAAQVALLYCALTMDAEFAARKDSNSNVTAQSFTRLRLGLYVGYFALVELLFLNNLQFTTTAFLAAQAGIFLVFLAARRRARQGDAAVAWPLFTAVILLVVAGLIRFESLSMALLVAAPLALVLARQASCRALIPTAVAAAFAVVLIGLATTYDRMAYEHDPQWSGFFSYNQLRVKFNDYGWTSYTPQTAGVFSAVGWTKNDHEMIAHWFFDDPVMYSEANLRAVLEAYPWKTERLTGGFGWQICRGMLRDRSVWAVFLVLPFFLAGVDRGRPARWAVIGSAIMAVVLVALLTWNVKLIPARVYFPLLSFPLSVALLFPASSQIASSLPAEKKNQGTSRSFPAWKAGSARPTWTRPVIVLLVVGVVMGLHHQCRRSVRVHRERRALQTFLADLRPSGRELYVCWEAAMPFELLSPLDNLSSWSRIPLLNLVWTQRTPWQEEIKRRFGISNLAQAMCDRDDVVLVATPLHRSLFATFVKEHFRSDVEFVPSASAGEKLVAGRFQRRALPGQTAKRPSFD